MINLSLRPYNPSKAIDKNNLYRVNETTIIKFIEQHQETKEIVNMEIVLKEEQYGIYANEYRRPGTEKEGCKTTDVLACIIDKKNKKIKSIVFDVKNNISAFSDDLLKEEAMITAIKEVHDFIEQIHAELLHKESFLIYYKDAGYMEHENVGIVTKSFEPEKFRAVAQKLETLMSEEKKDVSALISLKLKNSIRPYEPEIESLYNFADKKLIISKREYPLRVYILQKENNIDYEITIRWCI